jgi:DNA polymerase I-like protein with 3'-5' exonuclease and polymerase domains
MKRYPTVENFYASSISTCRETLKAFTLIGRRRFLPEIAGHNTYERWQAERQATNTVIQGTAADAARLAMIACDEAELDYHYGAEMLLQSRLAPRL